MTRNKRNSLECVAVAGPDPLQLLKLVNARLASSSALDRRASVTSRALMTALLCSSNVSLGWLLCVDFVSQPWYRLAAVRAVARFPSGSRDMPLTSKDLENSLPRYFLTQDSEKKKTKLGAMKLCGIQFIKMIWSSGNLSCGACGFMAVQVCSDYHLSFALRKFMSEMLCSSDSGTNGEPHDHEIEIKKEIRWHDFPWSFSKEETAVLQRKITQLPLFLASHSVCTFEEGIHHLVSNLGNFQNGREKKCRWSSTFAL